MNKFCIFLLGSILWGGLHAQIIVNTSPTAQQLAELLAGSNLVVNNATLTGATLSHGSFTNGSPVIGMSSGVILSTGQASTAPGPNSVGNTSNNMNTSGTAQMTALAGTTTYDAITLEFDFTVQSDFIQFNYIFASEEYPEYAPPSSSSYNDVFAFFISGPGITGEENIALIPNTTTAVAINYINAITNTQYYVDNTGGTDVSFDAFTTVLTARKDGLTPCSVYHLKLVIADAGDNQYNSAVLLQENSLVQGVVDVSTQTINSDTIALEGCVEASFSFSLDQASATDKTINFQIAGTATNGVDYSPIASSLTIPAGQTQASVFIHAISDGIPEGQESILIIYKPEVCSDWDTAYLFIDDAQPITYSLSGTNLDCFGDHTGEILINASGGFPPYTYHLTDPYGQISEYTSNPVTGLEAGQYTVYVYDTYGCKAEALVVGGLFNAGTTFLPDGSGVTYTSSLTISGFNAGTTLNSLSQLQNICLNMEHSYLGDLLITLQAPGGQSVQLKGGGGGSCDLGEPIATAPVDGSASSTLTDPGVGYDYCFNSSPMYGTMADESYNYSRNYTDGQGHSYSDYYLPAGSYTPVQSLSNLLGTPLNGTWTVYVTDQYALDNGYIFNWTLSFISDLPDTVVVLDEPDSIGISNYITHATCGDSNGSINISANGDFSPFTFLWNTGASTEDVSGLAAGTYSVTVTDSHNCHDSAFFAVSNMGSMSISSSILPVTCAGGNTGSINITPYGGTPVYTFLWSNGATTEDISNLAAGNYSVTVTDAGGCQLVRLFTVETNAPVSISVISQQNELCSSGNGVISVNAFGGSGSFGYVWNTGATTSTLSNLHTGTYSVTVTDAYSCTASGTYTISNDVSNCSAYCYLNITDNSIVEDQCGQSLGSIDISVNQAAMPFLVQWSNGATTEDISGLHQGTYTVTLTDANQCVKTHSVVVGNNTGSLSQTLNSLQNETCGSGNGSIDIDVSGGAMPYSYQWSSGATSQDIANLPAGSYVVTVTDANHCQSVHSYSLINDVGNMQVSASIVHESCNGSNGAIDQTVTGGFGNKTYLWSNGAATQDVSGLHAGTYSCSVTDAGGCLLVRVYNITNLSGPLTVTSVQVTNEACDNASGAINITVSGTGLTYHWNTGATTEDISGLTAATYICTITNATGCTTTTGNIHVFNTAGTIAVNTQTIVDEVCGNGLGSLLVDVSGGNAPLTYLWSNGSSSQDIYSLHAGTYNLTVSDAVGCEYVYTGVVDNLPGTLVFQNAVVTPETCGNSNGAINILISGGNTPYTYLWSNSATSEDLGALTAGTYSVTVHDGQGCEVQHTETVQNLANNMILTWQVTNEVCSDSTGSIDLSVSGGSIPYSFLWNNAAVTEDISLLPASTYSCTVTDNTGCTIHTGPVIVNNSAGIMTASTTVTDETCNQINGAIDLSVNGGSLPLTYLWSTSAVTQDLSGLSGGMYSYTVTDYNGCMVSGNATVLSTSGNLTLSAVISDEFCNSNTGSVELTVTGGVSPYNFIWSNAQTVEDISGLTAGIYSCTVTDATGCTVASPLYTVNDNPGTLNITGMVVTNEICNHNNGRINLSVAGGTTPYTFNWSNGAHTEDVLNLTSGLYSVTVVDASGCSAFSQAVVYDDNGSFGITDFTVTDEHCDDHSGAVDIAVAGGTLPYTYQWSNGATTQDISGLSDGSFQVYVTDASGCSDHSDFTVLNVGADLDITMAGITQAVCSSSTGAINITFSGGTAPYLFLWSNGSHTQNLNNATAGNYSLTITDANGCSTSGSWSIGNEPGTLSVSGTSGNEYCGNGAGSILQNTLGGASPYVYAWNSGATSEDLTGLHSGNYSVTVTDQFGCSIVRQYAVQNITSGLSITQDSVLNENCSQSDGAVYVTIGGGTPPYTVLWNTGATSDDISGIDAGNYSLTVTDATSCASIMNVTVASNTGGMSVSFFNTQNETCSNATGFIDIEISGGTGPYTYLWSNGATTQDIISLSQGTYNVSVTDQTGCVMTQSYAIANGSGTNISSSAIVENTVCESHTGAIDLTVLSGLQPFTYLWNNGSIGQDIYAADAGTYTVVIGDAAGCHDTASFVIAQETNINLAFYYVYVYDDNCWQGEGAIYWEGDGSYYLTYYLNGIPYSYPQETNLNTGWYNVAIMDENGCQLDSNVFVDNTSTMTISGTADDEMCDGSNGAIDLQVAGTGPFTYFWNTGAITEDLSGLASGTYTCSVSDGSCTDNISFTITNNYDFSTAVSVSDEYCGDGTGSVNLSVSPVTSSAYTFLWSNGATTEDLSGVSAGVYYCTVTRVSSGCQQVVCDTVYSLSSGLSISSTITSDSCSLGLGSCTVTMAGGSGSYDYYWGHGPVATTLNNMVAGSYTFTAIDQGDNCSTTAFIEIPDIRTFHASGVVYDASCSSCNDGNIDIIVTDVAGYTNAYTYSWSHGATTQDGISLMPGSYTVTVTSSSGCDTVMTFDVLAPDGTADQIIESNDLQLTPNPADNVCIISWKLPDGEKGTIQICDMQGRKLSVWKVSGERSKTFDTSDMAPGQYSVILSYDGRSVRKKLMVVR